MKKRVFIENFKWYVAILFCSVHFFAKAELLQVPCAMLTSPQNGATNVSIITAISFELVPGAVNYFVDLGTVPEGTDILNDFNAGSTGTFVPPQGLPENTLVYITIRAFFVSNSLTCDSQSFTTEDNVLPPSCTQVTNPSDGSVEVPVETNLSWGYAPRATGYMVHIGTTPGGTDVLDQDVGNVLTYNIPFNLESNTTYYVTIIPYNENGSVTGCPEIVFTTETLDMFPPGCTQVTVPADGATEIALTPILMWDPVPNADGYLISVGTSPTNNDVLDETDIGNSTSTAVIDFDEGTTYYVTIIPYNDAGEATNCIQTTFMTTFGCGPFLDPFTGEIVNLNPIITLEDSYQICRGEDPLELSYTEPALFTTWFVGTDTGDVVFSEDRFVSITESGLYRLEVTVEEDIEAGTILCTSTHSFEVTASEPPVIENLSFTNQGLTAAVTVTVSGDGDYEYAHSSINGPYQSSPVLNQVPFNNIDIYVRDRNGCGIANKTIRPDLGFPKYFTPNNDGINDTWQVRGVIVDGETITQIEIFDRFGKRIITISPFGRGWDGTYGGRTLLDQGYWYKASTTSSRVFIGSFALRK